MKNVLVDLVTSIEHPINDTAIQHIISAIEMANARGRNGFRIRNLHCGHDDRSFGIYMSFEDMGPQEEE